MTHPRAVQLIDEQIKEANGGSPSDFDAWQNRTEVVLRTVFGEASSTYSKFNRVRYTPGFFVVGDDLSPYQRAGVQEAVSILQAAKLELEIQSEAELKNATESEEALVADESSKKIFVVHGQDEARKYELESWLQKLVSQEPVILHQQPNGGRVLIEKFESSAASVAYAVVLLTADDRGRAALLDSEADLPRARQNVVFELGFFIGLIGRSNVAVMYEEGVELPSDISGLAYIPLDQAGAWKGKLASELNHAGIDVDWTAMGRM